jgi:hypothetical protein
MNFLKINASIMRWGRRITYGGRRKKMLNTNALEYQTMNKCQKIIVILNNYGFSRFVILGHVAWKIKIHGLHLRRQQNCYKNLRIKQRIVPEVWWGEGGLKINTQNLECFSQLHGFTKMYAIVTYRFTKVILFIAKYASSKLISSE